MHFEDYCNSTLGRSDDGCSADCDGGSPGYQPDYGNDQFICDAAGRWVPKEANDPMVCRFIPTDCPDKMALHKVDDLRMECTACELADMRDGCKSSAYGWWFLLLVAPCLYIWCLVQCPEVLPDCIAPQQFHRSKNRQRAQRELHRWVTQDASGVTTKSTLTTT